MTETCHPVLATFPGTEKSMWQEQLKRKLLLLLLLVLLFLPQFEGKAHQDSKWWQQIPKLFIVEAFLLPPWLSLFLDILARGRAVLHARVPMIYFSTFLLLLYRNTTGCCKLSFVTLLWQWGLWRWLSSQSCSRSRTWTWIPRTHIEKISIMVHACDSNTWEVVETCDPRDSLTSQPT